MNGFEIVRRATIEEIVGYRNKAIAMYGEAFSAIAAADALVKEAAGIAALASPGINTYNSDHEQEISAFANAVKLPDRDQYLRTARKLIDINAWSWIIERTDLERLMDHEAKKKLREQMKFVPEPARGDRELITSKEAERGLPELTVENVMATLQQFMLDADMIFKRGMANVFSSLDRRFRSHDGFKVGSRLILTRVFNDWGSLNWGSVRDQLIDIERIFAVLDGCPQNSFRSALGALEQDRRHHSGPAQSECHTEYFRIKGYKNGNAHLWFQRDDLVEKVNKTLAEYYGEVIADGQTQEEDPLADVKNTPAKRYGFFPTPDPAAKLTVEQVSLHREKDAAPLLILEPSAGTGNLARLCVAEKTGQDGGWGTDRPKAEYSYRALVDCVEIQPALAADLSAEGIYRRVYCENFLKLSPETTGLYDRVVMNPPFDRERDIDHVMHALEFLKADGQLVAVMSAGTEFRETKKSTAFRALMKQMGAKFDDLPDASFASVGTYCNTIVLTVWKDSRVRSWGSGGRNRFE